MFTGGRVLRVAGVSLENASLEISVVDKKLGIIKPITSEKIALPESEQERTTILKETFQRLKEKYNVKDIVIGMSFNDFLHNIIDMPSLSRADTRNALFYELEKYLPLPPEEYIYDFSAIEKVQKDIKNLVFSIRRDKISGLIDIIRGAGLTLVGIRCSFIEAINEFIKSNNIKDAVFIHVTSEAYHTILIRSQRPEWFRYILKGKNALAEFERLIGSFTGSVYISGTAEPGISDKLNAKTFALSLPYVLARSVLRKPKISLNFMPEEFLPEKKDYYPYLLGTMAIVAVILFFLSEIYPYYKDSTALSNVEKRLEGIKAKASGFLEARKEMESIYEKKKFLYEFREKRNLNIKVLAELSTILPKDTWLIGISIDERGKIEIEGFSKHAAGIIKPLSKSKLFTKIRFTSPIVLQNNEEKFSVTMEIAE
jgi:hypothetical protein